MDLPPTFVEEFHEKVPEVKYFQLGKTDMTVSNFAMGGACFGNIYGEMSFETSKSVLLKALKSGVNLIDTAPFYGEGKSEEVIGKIIKDIPRKAFYLATKVGRYKYDKQKMHDYTAQKVKESIEESLRLLGVDYVDILTIHEVEFCFSLEQIIKHTLPTVQALKSQGKIRYVGMSGYDLGVLKRIVELSPDNSFDTILSYCRYTVFNKDLSQHLNYFKSKGIGILNASPVGMGLLTDNPPAWHPAPSQMRFNVEKAISHCKDNGKNLADLAVQWCFHQSEVPICLIGVKTLDELEVALKSAKNPLTKENAEFLEEIVEKYFKYLAMNNWDNLPVAKFWEKMNINGWKQPSNL